LVSRYPKASWRLTFAHDGNQFRIVQRQRVEMITPVKDRARTVEGRAAGFWLELRDDKDEVLFQSDIARLLGAQRESFAPDGTIQQHIGPVSQRRFDVLVPDHPEARTVSLLAPSPSVSMASWASAPAREVARFPLRDDSAGTVVP